MKLLAAVALALPLAAAAQYDPAAPPDSWAQEPAAPTVAAPAPAAAATPTPSSAAPAPSAASGAAPAVAPQGATPPAPAPSAWPAPAEPMAPAAAQPAYPPGYAPSYQPPYARRQQRGSWYIGFGLGSGDASVTDSGETHSFGRYVYPDGRGTVSIQFEVGATLSPKLLLGLEVAALSMQGQTRASGSRYDSNLQASDFDAVFTYFPYERGFFLRGGAGVTSLTYQLEPYGTDRYDGLNVRGGLGYAFWLGQSFNLTLNLEGARQWYRDSAAPDATQYWAAFLGCSWY